MAQTDDALQTIRDALHQQGLPGDRALFNQASQALKEGHTDTALRYVEVLLGLYPQDGQAWLLRSRVHAELQQWSEALRALDLAEQLGQPPNPPLREHLQQRAHAGAAGAPGVSDKEVARLKAEHRHMRAQIQTYVTENRLLKRDTSRWAITSGLMVIAILVLTVVQLRMLNDHRDPSESAAPEAVADLQGPVTPAPTPATRGQEPTERPGAVPAERPAAPPTPRPSDPPTDDAPAPIRDPSLGELASRALSDADADHGGQLRVTVRGSSATLTGKVDHHQRRRRAIDTLLAMPQIDKVDDAGVINLAQRDGTTYTVAAGDSLSKIAYKHYGDQSLSKHILDANPQLGGRINLQIGDQLQIPPAP